MNDSDRIEVNPNENFDAQRLSENIESGEVGAPASNFDKDYQKAQEFATSDGLAPTSEFKSDEDALKSGNPDDFREMAQKVKLPEDVAKSQK
jgi:hypothetical protein